MTVRHHYVLDLGDFVPVEWSHPSGLFVRRPTPGDAEALAVLMLKAYRGTIDYDGEGIEEARDEVGGHFGGAPIDEASTVLAAGGGLVAACLVAEYEGDALIGYVMTAPDFKRQGLGRSVTAESLSRIAALGYSRVHAWITEGNEPSERIFVGLGFGVVD